MQFGKSSAGDISAPHFEQIGAVLAAERITELEASLGHSLSRGAEVKVVAPMVAEERPLLTAAYNALINGNDVAPETYRRLDELGYAVHAAAERELDVL